MSITKGEVSSIKRSNLVEGTCGRLLILRYVRDEVLKRTPEGREIVRMYYQLSPALVKALQEDRELQGHMKGIIDAVVPLCKEAVAQSIPQPR
jgi:hypothetical protein